jgi:hypothetical protein
LSSIVGLFQKSIPIYCGIHDKVKASSSIGFMQVLPHYFALKARGAAAIVITFYSHF